MQAYFGAGGRCAAPPSTGRSIKRAACVVQAKMKIKTKIAQNHKRVKVADIDLDKVYSDKAYAPAGRLQAGGAKIVSIPGKGRGLVSVQDIRGGDTILACQPVGPLLTAPLGQPLNHVDLQKAFVDAQPKLSPADKHRLALLHGGPLANTQVDLDDFGETEEKLAQRAKKSAAAKKGFSSAALKEPELGGDLPAEQLREVVALNAYGEDHTDLGAAPLRQGPLQAFMGLWPEYAMVNHSCVPNSLPVVVGSRLLLRAGRDLPAGVEVSVNYLGPLVTEPLAVRRRALEGAYKFTCNCPRCKAESDQPQEVADVLMSAHNHLASGEVQVRVRAAMESNDTQALVSEQAVLQEQVDRLAQLTSSLPKEVAVWMDASMYRTHELLAMINDRLAGATSDETLPLRLAAIMEAIAPGSDEHCFLTYETVARATEKHQTKEHVVVAETARAMIRAHLLRYGTMSDHIFQRMLQARSLHPFYFGRLTLPAAPAASAST